MKKITIIKKKEVLIGIIAISLLVIGFVSYRPNNQTDYGRIADVANYSESSNIGEATLVSSNSLEESENQLDENVSEEIIEETEVETDYFAEARMQRDTTYSETLEIYQNILESSSVSSDQKAIAQNEITNITEEKKTIATAENLIKMKGFEDVVIFKNSSGVSVIIRSDVLLTEEVAQIQNIIEREFEIESKNINITNK